MKRTLQHLLLGAAVLVLATCDDPSGPQGLPAPTNVTVVPGPFLNQNTIMWLPVPGAEQYNVYWGLTPGVTPQNGTKITDGGPPPLFTHSGLTPGTTYYYVVTTSHYVGTTNLHAVEGPPSVVAQATASDNIGLRFMTPRLIDSYSQSPLNLVAGVISRFKIVNVTATVGDSSVGLTLLSSAGNEARWSGAVPLRGLGPTTVILAATDAFANVVSASIEVIHSELPTLTVTAPDSLVVARPTLRVAASCLNERLTSCSSLTVGVAGAPPLAAGQSSVDQNVSLAAHEGQFVTLEFRGTDSYGQVMTAQRRVFVESSAQLTEVASVNGPIVDVQSDRILFLNQSAGANALTIHDRLSGQEVVIYDPAGYVPAGGRLTPTGAMFREGSPGLATVHEWTAGGLRDHGGSLFLVVKGRYALFMTTAGLIRRDVVGDVNTIVSAGGYGDVAENGDVAYYADYYATGYQVYLVRNGATTQLTDDRDQWGFGPLTDGVNVVYAKGFPPGYSVAFYDTSGEHVLGPSNGYRAVNGWIAWGGAAGQVWTRSPAGQVVQASKFSSGSALSALGPNGEVAFTNGSRRYLAVPDYNTPPREIGSSLGTALFQNGGLFVIIGRSLFQVNP